MAFGLKLSKYTDPSTIQGSIWKYNRMDFEMLHAIYPCIIKDSHIDINKDIACKDT